MKTMKLQLAILLTGLAFGVYAQTGPQKKTCIKLDIIENGKETKIDTCFNLSGLDDVEKELKAMGLKDLPNINMQMGGLSIVTDSTVKDGKVEKEVTISDDEGDGKQEKVKVITGKDGEASSVTIVADDADKDAEAYSYSTTNNGKSKVIVKSSGKGTSTIIINSDEDDKDGKKTKETRVYVFKKVEVKNLSSEDKKELPDDVSSEMAKSQNFTNLVMSPNPAEGNVNIKYKSTSNEPLQIKVYDTGGKTVYTETDSNVSDQVNKTIPLKGLSPGIYFVHLLQGKQSEVRKLVVK
jgi:hypothetical protein